MKPTLNDKYALKGSNRGRKPVVPAENEDPEDTDYVRIGGKRIPIRDLEGGN